MPLAEEGYGAPTPESRVTRSHQREPHLSMPSYPQAFVYPELLAGEFTRLEFPRRLKGDDLGQKVLFRDHHMRGW